MKLAVVTGGHPFDVISFHDLVRHICGEDVTPYVQHLDEFATSPPECLQAYDAVLFYFFPQTGPVDDGPWQQGRPRAALECVLGSGSGLVVLHHALLAYPQWETWDQVVGCRERSRFTYHPGRELRVVVSASGHPITQGVSGWQMHDETYCMMEPDGVALLTTEHPESMRTLAWTRSHGASRVACLQSGHDAQCWNTPGFREILGRSVRWAARPAPGREPLRLEAAGGVSA
jgi:trehalose utilization protein